MKTFHGPVFIAQFLSIAVVMLVAASCSSVAPTSRTGAVHTINVAEGPDPEELSVRAGDEVRWVNLRTQSIEIDLVKVNPETLSCNRGFFDALKFARDFATLNPNESASACFVISGDVNYNIRMESALPGGQKIVSGVVRVGN